MRRFGGPDKEMRSKDHVCKNVGGVWRGNEAKRNDLAVAEAEPPGGEAYTDPLREVARTF
jgi:hypothetical protein